MKANPSLLTMVVVSGMLLSPSEAKETTITVPSATAAGTHYAYDFLDPVFWSNGLPEAGDKVTIAYDSKTPYATNSAPVFLEHLAMNCTDFYLKSAYAFTFDSTSNTVVSGDGKGFKFKAPAIFKAPVQWNATANSTQCLFFRDHTSVFEEALSLAGSFMVDWEAGSGSPGTVNISKLISGSMTDFGNNVGIDGGGVLTIDDSESFGGKFFIRNSRLVVTNGNLRLNDPSVTAALPVGAIAHFDASDASTIDFTNGTRVATWRSKTGEHTATLHTGSHPVWRDRELNGLPVVDFGGIAGKTSNGQLRQAAALAALKFDAPLTDVKSVAWVLGSQGGGGWLFSNVDDTHRILHRAGPDYGCSVADAWGADVGLTAGATFRVDGEEVDITKAHPNGSFQVIVMTKPDALSAGIAGFGFDNLKNNNTRNGGQMIAEYLAFDRELSAVEVKALEKYLYRKWFAGSCDLRSVGANTRATLEIAEPRGEGHLPRLGATSGRGHIRKEGPGPLAIEHPRLIQDRLELKEGRLVFDSNDPAPRTEGVTAAIPSDGLILHLDASDAASITTNALNQVTEWRDLTDSGNRLVPGVDGTTVGVAPVYRKHAVTGRPMVDFGGCQSKSFMNLATRITTARTVVYAFDGRYGGQHLLSDVSTTQLAGAGGTSFHRGASPMFNFGFVGDYDVGCPIGVNGGVVYDGLYQVNPGRECLRGTPQILTFSGDSGNRIIGRIGMDRTFTSRSGGLAVGELLVWNRVLSRGEMAQVYKALEGKWLAYAAAPLRSLDVVGEGEIAVKTDFAVDTLSGTGTVAAAAGTVAVEGIANDFQGAFAGTGGRWNVRHDRGAVPTANPVTDGLLAHFDPSDPSLVTTNASGQITLLTSVNDANLTAAKFLNAPTLSTGDASIGHMPIIDCGDIYSSQGLAMSTSFTNVQTVICVYGGQKGGSQLFGSDKLAQAFQRNISSADKPIFEIQNQPTQWCEAWVDGRKVIATVDGLKSGYQLLSFVWPRNLVLNWLGMRENAANGGGGSRYGEFLMWNRCLTDEERKSVEAYLAAKWFGRATHGYEVAGRPVIPGYATKAGAPADFYVPAGETNTIGYLTGEGGVAKSGAGVLKFTGSLSELSGGIEVKEGEAVLVTTCPDPDVLPVTAGLLAHFDAEKGVTTNANGVVSAWASQEGAVPYGGYVATQAKNSATYPKLVEDAINGHQAIDFGPYGTAGCGLWFDPSTHVDSVVNVSAHDYGSIPGCKSIFLVFNSAAGGGFVVGNLGDSYFHRNTTAVTPGSSWGRDVAGALFTPGVASSTSAILDCESVGSTQTGVLNGDWQLLEVYKTGNAANVAGFAFDRFQHLTDRHGGNKVAEAVFFDRSLDADEKLALRMYFYNKYYARSAPGAGTLDRMYANAPAVGGVKVAEGAKLDLNGFVLRTGALSGAGSVKGDLALAGPVTAGDGGCLTVDGTLTVLPDGEIVLANPLKPVPGTYRVASATSIVADAATLATWRRRIEVNGVKYTLSLLVADGVLYAKVASGGLLVIVR